MSTLRAQTLHQHQRLGDLRHPRALAQVFKLRRVTRIGMRPDRAYGLLTLRQDPLVFLGVPRGII
jgi:hypothetical protein